jgi:transcriptional antiterminator Rof (Rho-off)
VNYTPVSCSLYDTLERLALRRATVVLESTDHGVEVRQTIRLEDVVSRNRQEFLRGTDTATGAGVMIRLDTIRRITDLADLRPEPPAFC